MSTKDTGGPAFPEDEVVKNMGYDTSDRRPVKGMTMRDYFAAKAMSGLVVNGNKFKLPQLAAYSYQMADALLKARQS